jgi:hypothetical protein
MHSAKRTRRHHLRWPLRHASCWCAGEQYHACAHRPQEPAAAGALHPARLQMRCKGCGGCGGGGLAVGAAAGARARRQSSRWRGQSQRWHVSPQ